MTNKEKNWQPMDNAPLDRDIQADIPGYGKDNVIAWQDGYLDSNQENCGAWVFVTEREPPACWTDGICWEVNEDGISSVKPVAWKDLP